MIINRDLPSRILLSYPSLKANHKWLAKKKQLCQLVHSNFKQQCGARCGQKTFGVEGPIYLILVLLKPMCMHAHLCIWGVSTAEQGDFKKDAMRLWPMFTDPKVLDPSPYQPKTESPWQSVFTDVKIKQGCSSSQFPVNTDPQGGHKAGLVLTEPSPSPHPFSRETETKWPLIPELKGRRAGDGGRKMKGGKKSLRGTVRKPATLALR